MKHTYQSGQIIVVLLLVMLVVLSVVLAITQRSTSNLSSSTETEQSTRAYSAAEAGLEQALQRGTSNPAASPILSQTINLPGNSSTATIQNSGLLPVAGSQIALEYPPVGKESIAQFWLVDTTTPANNYNRNSYSIYFGNPNISPNQYDDANGASAKNISPAIEVTTVKQTTIGGSITYETQKNFYDSLSSRAATNKFITTTSPSTPITCSNPTVNTILKTGSQFYCRVDITLLNCNLASCIPQLVRVRLLYANLNQKIALAPVSGASLPPQVELYTSTGKAVNFKPLEKK
jgi:nitrate reductase cytochrome c-type subunit